MKITKKFIKENIRSEKEMNVFNGSTRYILDLNDMQFEKPMFLGSVFKTQLFETKNPETIEIGNATNKTQFIDVVHTYLNS